MVMDMEKDIMDINKTNMKIKTYVINLKDSVHRRETVLTELAKYSFLDVELVEAVDGRKMKLEDVKSCFDCDKFISKYSRTPQGGEIGCILSHRNCYQKLLESEEEFALILEDDVCFLYPEDIETTLNNVLNEYKNNKPYFITLAYHLIYYPAKYRKLSKYTMYKIYNAYGTCAYLINRKAAKRLLSVSFPYTVADDFPFIRKCGVNVEGIYPTLAVGASTLKLIPTEIQEDSTRENLIEQSQSLGTYFSLIRQKVLFFLRKLSFRAYNHGINE